MPIDGKKLAAALVLKGFRRESERDHIWFRYYVNGKYSGVATCMSHSRRAMKDIRGPLASKMKSQLRLDSSSQLDDLANCPMTAGMYAAHLRAKNIVP